jgi:hypothetical protein
MVQATDTTDTGNRRRKGTSRHDRIAGLVTTESEDITDTGTAADAKACASGPSDGNST